MTFKCPFCSRTFSGRSGYTQHVGYCMRSQESEESSLITDIQDIQDMSVESNRSPNIDEEVKN